MHQLACTAGEIHFWPACKEKSFSKSGSKTHPSIVFDFHWFSSIWQLQEIKPFASGMHIQIRSSTGLATWIQFYFSVKLVYGHRFFRFFCGRDRHDPAQYIPKWGWGHIRHCFTQDCSGKHDKLYTCRFLILGRILVWILQLDSGRRDVELADVCASVASLAVGFMSECIVWNPVDFMFSVCPSMSGRGLNHRICWGYIGTIHPWVCASTSMHTAPLFLRLPSKAAIPRWFHGKQVLHSSLWASRRRGPAWRACCAPGGQGILLSMTGSIPHIDPEKLMKFNPSCNLVA